MMRRFLSTLVLALGAAGITSGLARASIDVPAVGPDSQGTVYLLADYAQPFDVAYDARLDPQPHNASWWILDMIVTGRAPGGGLVRIGVARGYPTSASIEFFTSTTYPGSPSRYVSAPERCAAACRLEIRGDRRFIEAFANGARIGKWSRERLAMQEPYLQIDAEVHGKNDVLYGTMTPVTASVGGVSLLPPLCAMTEHGMDAERLPDGTLSFFGGFRDDAEPYFFALDTQETGPDCGAAPHR